MNNEEKNTREKMGTPPAPESTPPPKKSGYAVAIICAITFISLYAVVNIASFSQIFSRLMSVLTPIILGFGLALVLFAGIREQLSLVNIPKGMDGMAIALVTAGLLAMAFMGFSGVDKGLAALFGV